MIVTLTLENWFLEFSGRQTGEMEWLNFTGLAILRIAMSLYYKVQ